MYYNCPRRHFNSPWCNRAGTRICWTHACTRWTSAWESSRRLLWWARSWRSRYDRALTGRVAAAGRWSFGRQTRLPGALYKKICHAGTLWPNRSHHFPPEIRKNVFNKTKHNERSRIILFVTINRQRYLLDFGKNQSVRIMRLITFKLH